MTANVTTPDGGVDIPSTGELVYLAFALGGSSSEAVSKSTGYHNFSPANSRYSDLNGDQRSSFMKGSKEYIAVCGGTEKFLSVFWRNNEHRGHMKALEPQVRTIVLWSLLGHG